MPSDLISGETLSKLCDEVENALEEIVIQFRGNFLEEEMDEKIRFQFESRLDVLITEKGGTFDSMSPKQHEYVRQRIALSLDLFKREYES